MKKIKINNLKLSQRDVDHTKEELAKILMLDQLKKELIESGRITDEILSNDQLAKLLTLAPDWKGCMDTSDREDMRDSICYHFTKMHVPAYCSPDAYKKRFWAKLESKLLKITKFIYGY